MQHAGEWAGWGVSRPTFVSSQGSLGACDLDVGGREVDMYYWVVFLWIAYVPTLALYYVMCVQPGKNGLPLLETKPTHPL